MDLPPGVTLPAAMFDYSVYRVIKVVQEALESDLAKREKEFCRLAESREEKLRLRVEELQERLSGMAAKLVLEMEKNGN
jgi:hypothetical protein